jgi:hypothetical protein
MMIDYNESIGSLKLFEIQVSVLAQSCVKRCKLPQEKDAIFKSYLISVKREDWKFEEQNFD